MIKTKDIVADNTFEKDITLKDAINLSNKISLFCRHSIPTLVRFKLQQLQAKLTPDAERYQKLNDEILDKLSPGMQLKKYDINGILNPAWKIWREEIGPIEESRISLKFEKLPLSMVARIIAEGGFPDELFYEDDACKKIFEKMIEDATKEKVDE